jgi:hypothetical protein
LSEKANGATLGRLSRATPVKYAEPFTGLFQAILVEQRARRLFLFFHLPPPMRKAGLSAAYINEARTPLTSVLSSRESAGRPAAPSASNMCLGNLAMSALEYDSNLLDLIFLQFHMILIFLLETLA